MKLDFFILFSAFKLIKKRFRLVHLLFLRRNILFDIENVALLGVVKQTNRKIDKLRIGKLANGDFALDTVDCYFHILLLIGLAAAAKAKSQFRKLFDAALRIRLVVRVHLYRRIAIRAMHLLIADIQNPDIILRLGALFNT